MPADAYLPDGTPLYFKCGRGSGKSTLQLEMYMSLITGLPIEDVRVAMRAAELDEYLKGDANGSAQIQSYCNRREKRRASAEREKTL